MALAEARAVWQRAANRCFVQEDAKRAPKLACCSSLTTSGKEGGELGASSEGGDQEVNSAVFVPFDPEHSYRNLSPGSKWWLQMQPGYCCLSGLMDAGKETCYLEQSSEGFVGSETEFVMVDQPLTVGSLLSEECCLKEEDVRTSYDMDCSVYHELDIGEICRKKGHGGVEALVSSNDVSFDFESSWRGSDKSGPWWRTDAGELALLVSQRSLSLMENCDLPSPQKPRVTKGVSAKSTSVCRYKTFAPSVHEKLVEPLSLVSSDDSVSGNTVGISFQKDELPSETQPGRETHGDVPKTDRVGEDTAQLLEALRHSQTRARESEKAAKEACAEKEHIVKLLLRQASHLFAYKQWFQLLQLENSTYSQVLSQQPPHTFPATQHFKSLRSTKMSKHRRKSDEKRNNIGKYAVVFAWGFGLVTAGVMLGWGIAWFFPPW